MAPSEDLLIGIATGMAHIEIHTRRFVTQELKGQVSFANNECRKIKKVKANSFLQRSFVGSDLNVGVCLHQERFHDDGSEWNPIGGDGTTKMYCTICKCDVSAMLNRVLIEKMHKKVPCSVSKAHRTE